MLQGPLGAIPGWVPVEPLTVLVAALVSVVIVALVSDGTDRRLDRLRRRFVLGVPWGTVLTITAVSLVYLFLQGGIQDPRDPLVIPFRSWSYRYPLGMLTAAFTHSSLGHVTGNLVATAAFGSVAEYAWGHYPRRRGSHSFGSWRANPYARILVVPAAAFVVGIFTALFALGPVVGFSGVVFAIAGFAIVQRPLTALLALLADQVLGFLVVAIQTPRVVAVPRPRVITPWWASIAIQGHAIGILLGLLLGFGLLYYRDRWPDPARLWFALLVFAEFQGLWALYLPEGNGRYVLFRWAGAAVVFVLAAVVVLGALDADRRAGAGLEWLTDLRDPGISVGVHSVALALVVALLLGLSVAAVPYNVAPIGESPAPQPTVEVRDYTVSYGEDVPDGYVGSVSLPYFDDPTAINASGVVVTSERRHVWQTVVLSSQLRNRGVATVEVGGVGWRRDVQVNRTGWRPAGNESVYKVYLRPAGEVRTLGYTSESRRADPVLGGRNVTLVPTEDGFAFEVSRDGRALATAPIPGPNATTTAGAVQFSRSNARVIATYEGTRVTVATRETALDDRS
jgi:membrane associated rhomboid family serine protease